jgi:hypothetical protein
MIVLPLLAAQNFDRARSDLGGITDALLTARRRQRAMCALLADDAGGLKFLCATLALRNCQANHSGSN